MFVLQPKQSSLLKAWDSPDITRIGFGGARGGAKSGGGRRCMLARREMYPGTTGLILRRTYPELYKSHIIKIFEEMPELRRRYNTQNKEIVFRNGSRLFFGSAEHEADLNNFYSAEFADIMVDEAQEFSQQELEKLSGSNRTTSNPYIVPKMVYTFMPGVSESGLPPIGLQYLKRVFADGELQGDEDKRIWCFIQAFAWDNIEWARKDLGQKWDPFSRTWSAPPGAVSEKEFYTWNEDKRREFFLGFTDFGQQLAALSDKQLRDAWLYGRWDVFKGQYFPHFNLETHTIPPEAVKIKRWHKRWISGDYGFDHPMCIHWHAEDEFGNVTTYRELYGREIGEAELGRRISEMSAGDGKISNFFFSADAFGKLNKKSRQPVTQMIGEAMTPGLPRPSPVDQSPGTRIPGWRLMHQLLTSGAWQISRECKELIKQLPTLIRDDKNTEDVKKVDYDENGIGDDAADSARYGLFNMLSVSQKPREEKRRELMETFDQRIARIRSLKSQSESSS